MKTNLNTAIVAVIGHDKTSAHQIAYEICTRKRQTINEIIQENQSIKITHTQEVPIIQPHKSGQQKRRERRKKLKK